MSLPSCDLPVPPLDLHAFLYIPVCVFFAFLCLSWPLCACIGPERLREARDAFREIEMPREAQERRRESQRDPERPREAKRSLERTKNVKRGQKMPTDAQRGREMAQRGQERSLLEPP